MAIFHREEYTLKKKSEIPIVGISHSSDFFTVEFIHMYLPIVISTVSLVL